MRHRHIALTVTAIALLGVAACGDDSDDDAGAFVNPSAAASTAAPSPSSAPSAKRGQAPVGKDAKTATDVVSASGLGPYLAGVGQKDLSSAKLISEVKEVDNCTAAAGLSKYRAPALAFNDGKLTRISITNTKVKTAAGAKVGMSYDEVKKLYPAGKQLDNWVGASAWYAAEGGNALLFKIADGKVSAIDAGQGEAVQFSYTDQQGC